MDTLDAALNLYTHYAQAEEITHYYGLLAQYGLLQAADEKKDAILLERCKKLLSRYPDQVKQENYNFACYRIGGNAAAWADMKGIYTDHRKELEQYGEQMLSAECDALKYARAVRRYEKGKTWHFLQALCGYHKITCQ